jgi:uncharacterized membrane protein
MTSLLPDYLMLSVCATTGLKFTTREHFAAALALDIPVFCVITKADLAPAAVLQRTLQETRIMLATATDTVSVCTSRVAGFSTDDMSDLGDAKGATWREADVEARLSDVPEAEVFNSDDEQQLLEQRQEQV